MIAAAQGCARAASYAPTFNNDVIAKRRGTKKSQRTPEEIASPARRGGRNRNDRMRGGNDAMENGVPKITRENGVPYEMPRYR